MKMCAGCGYIMREVAAPNLDCTVCGSRVTIEVVITTDASPQIQTLAEDLAVDAIVKRGIEDRVGGIQRRADGTERDEEMERQRDRGRV